MAKRKRTIANTNGKAHPKNRKCLAKADDKKKKQKIVSKKPSQPVIAPGSNWMAMKDKLKSKNPHKKETQHTPAPVKSVHDPKQSKTKAADAKKAAKEQAQLTSWGITPDKIVAMDCEMVGVGLSGNTSVLARCSIVDFDGNVVYDKYIRPAERVTDFRTHVSGIRAKMLKDGIPFNQCLKEIGKLMEGKIVVGHALKNDFKVLMFTPPRALIRDTARYRPYMRRKMTGTKLYPKSLKNLTQEILGRTIQEGEHNSVIDAQSALDLYKREQFPWEKYLQKSKKVGPLVGIAPTKTPEDTSTSTEIPEKVSTGNAEVLNGIDEEDLGLTKPTDPSHVHIPDSQTLALMEYGD